MITSREEYKIFIAADAMAMGIDNETLKGRLKAYIMNPRWRFIKKMRKAEYYKNSSGPIAKLFYIWHYVRYKRFGMKLGYTIPLNVCGKGLSLPHYGTIVISKYAKIGDYGRIHVCVNIGAHGGNNAPTLGNNCYVGPGVKMFGGIKLGDNVQIGANAVVNKSFEEDNIVLAGVPAKVVKRIDDKKSAVFN